MKLYQRACLILAHEGVSGLCRRTLRKLFVREQDRAALMDQARIEYARLVEDFRNHPEVQAFPEAANYYWYHTLDLGNGLVTPGDYDYRPVLPAFGFPHDMSGMRVLDVGSATGYFAFEFARRGADVTSVELPSLADWDITTQEREATLRGLLNLHGAGSLEDVHRLHLEGPFEFCRRRLGVKVRRCYSRIYDLTPDKVGADGFDLVFVGDVLPHIFSPFQALDRLAALCRGTLVVAQDFIETLDRRPAMVYIGGDTPGGDNRNWWLPNRVCLEQMLRKLGFGEVRAVGRHAGVMRRSWHHYHRTVIHAGK
jgi:tRNA (mo5U34)-methyltransferase